MKEKSGFTLIEAVMSIVLIGIICLVFAGYILAVINNWSFLVGQKSISLESRAAIYKIVREFKRIQASTDISAFSTSSVTFKDIDNNTITYAQSGADLQRNTETLFGNLKNPGGLIFTYLTGNGAVASLASQIRIIRVRLIVIKGANKFAIESSARIRPGEL